MTYEDGQIVWGIVMRGLAICNIVHFLSFYSQIVGLIGSKGLHPVKAFLDRVDHNAKHQWGFFKKYYEYPTIYWISHDHFFLQHSCLLGAIISFLLFIYPTSPFPFFICAILSLSLVTVLGPFNLLMEPMMVEVNILCSFGSVLVLNGFSYFAILLYRFYVFRVMLSAGLVKWYGSKKWKELTAMDTHYLTQPLPNPISYLL